MCMNKGRMTSFDERKYLLVGRKKTNQEVTDEEGAQRAHQDFRTGGHEKATA